MKHVIGKCPECGGEVIEFGKFYGCKNWQPIDGGCSFTLPKKFAGRTITPHLASMLISQRYTPLLNDFVSQNGTLYSAALELQFTGKKWRLQLRFTE